MNQLFFAHELEILWCGLFVEYPGSLPETQFRGITGFTNTNGRQQASTCLLAAQEEGAGGVSGVQTEGARMGDCIFQTGEEKQARMPADNYA